MTEYYDTGTTNYLTAAHAFAVGRKITVPVMATVKRWDSSTKTWEDVVTAMIGPQRGEPKARQVKRPS